MVVVKPVIEQHITAINDPKTDLEIPENVILAP